MKVQCPAKVNLFLEVTGKRPDGYHRLATLFAKVDIYDVLDMTATMTGRVELEVSSSGPALSAGPDNLVYRAADAFFKAFEIGQGVRITLTKRIPMGAGLGGGSSDAAGTLLGLAKLYDIKLGAAEKKVLRGLAVKLGADVPFFLHPANFCVGTGIGERLRPLKVKKSLPYMVLAFPGIHVSTPQVFKTLPLPARPAVLTSLSQLDRLTRCLEQGRPVEEWAGCLFNRLEESSLPVLAQVERARKILSQAGVQGARMSGSGSSVFGFVASHAEGEKCVKRLSGYPWKVFLTSCSG